MINFGIDLDLVLVLVLELDWDWSLVDNWGFLTALFTSDFFPWFFSGVWNVGLDLVCIGIINGSTYSSL